MLHIIMIMLINNPNCTPKYLFSFKSFVKSHMDNLDQLFFFTWIHNQPSLLGGSSQELQVDYKASYKWAR